MEADREAYLRKIPAVNDLLATDKGQRLVNQYSHDLVVEGIRKITERVRSLILESELEELATSELNLEPEKLLDEVEDYLLSKTESKLTKAVNATGVVVHTNLGRSLLSSDAQDKLEQLSTNYSTLEIDRQTGQRGSRYQSIEELLVELTGAEAALVVNNNAAAVLLVLSSLASGQEAIIARSQLVEIGGSFRIPDVMEQSGASLKEVGTTNRVHLADYKRAINEETGLLLKVHPSNYRVLGFSKEVALEELVALGADYELPVVEDLGSGILVDATEAGLSYEPTVQDSIAAGADLVTFSGDKLLGGPQAGLIVGSEEYIAQLKENPLTRALRVDKLTMGALEATLKEYRDLDSAKERIPTLRMLWSSPEELKKQAIELKTSLEKVASPQLKLEIKEAKSQVGGGAFPVEGLPTYVVRLLSSDFGAEELAERLRLNQPPIFSRISEGAVLLDLRTLDRDDFYYLETAIDDLTS